MVRNISKAKSTIVLTCVSLFVFLHADATRAQPTNPAQSYESFLKHRFSAGDPNWRVEKLCPVSESVAAARVLANYGSMYSARDSIILPGVCIHRSESEYKKYRDTLKTNRLEVGGASVEFQIAAAEALQQALIDAEVNGLRITPLDGSIAGGRSYGDTLMLWNSRVFPALDYWVANGRLTEADRNHLAAIDLDEKVEKILEWESRGIFFSTSRTRSILTSTAPPGASQHLAFMAFDIVEYWNPRVRTILNRNGWYQTIVDDAPHFTYLGMAEEKLPSRGLRIASKGGFQFWIPNIENPAVFKN